MKLLIVLPFCAADLELAKSLLKWIAELGPCRDRSLLLVADFNLPEVQIAEVELEAGKAFGPRETIKTAFKLPDEKKPIGPNWMFETVLRWQMNQEEKKPFIWLEPDCVPISKDWLSKIEIEYCANGKPMLGEISGGRLEKCAVYPADADTYFLRQVVNKLVLWNHATAHVSTQACHSNLFHHLSGPSGFFRPGCVLLHGCKDASMFGQLRKSAHVKREPITIRRRAAIGDTIMATGVAKKLHEAGFDVDFATEGICAEAIGDVPWIRKFVPVSEKADINLDEVYEKHPNRCSRSIGGLFLESAKSQLNGHGFRLQNFHNITPQLTATEAELSAAKERLKGHPKPWVMVCPRSDFWPNRTVPKRIWKAAADQSEGTWFWTGTEKAPIGMVDLKCHKIRHLHGYFSLADVVVSVDSGPLHIAAALGRPIVAILQSSSPELHLTDQRDFSMIIPPLGCLNCQLQVCPISKDEPPCRNIDPTEIATAVAAKLGSRLGNKVSAIIPVWKPNIERLNRCIRHTLPQVDEIVISIDGDGAIPAGITQAPNIRFVQNLTSQRLGYGKTCNRAARQSVGRYLLMLNDDVFLNSDAVSKMVCAMSDETAVVGCRLWYPDGTIQHGGTSRGPLDIGFGHKDHREKKPSITKCTEMEFVTFAAALVRREAFYEVLGFDERYDCYSEDSDLCMSVRQKGWRVVYEPNAEGIHDESQTTGPLKRQLAEQSGRLFAEKWGWYFTKNPPGKVGAF